MWPNRWSAAFVLALFLLLTTSVQAQWILAARAAKHEINHMTQRSASGGYDVATVVLDADPSKVYDKTIELLKTHPEVKITKEDKPTGTIEIQKGKQVSGFQIYALGDKVTQMIVVSESANQTNPIRHPWSSRQLSTYAQNSTLNAPSNLTRISEYPKTDSQKSKPA
jgi:hypothetical protein